MYDDPDAYGYFEFKYQQLKHDLTNIRESECRQLKERYNQRFKDLKTATWFRKYDPVIQLNVVSKISNSDRR
ncbi:hypothetical protein AAUPMB_10971 [Pasteurella multocida subsp. multocida str. Anand1_buffalo]|nr:hypothetical protein AAUPMB_10971 [Pasteurella multocida subsp. multocida str. Anand1_buffalo]